MSDQWMVAICSMCAAITGAFGGRTGMVIFLKLNLPILKIPDDEPTTREQDADASGIFSGLLLGAILGGCLAAFPTMSVLRGTFGVLAAFLVVPVTYVVLLGCGTVLVIAAGYTINGLQALSNRVSDLVLRIMKVLAKSA